MIYKRIINYIIPIIIFMLAVVSLFNINFFSFFDDIIGIILAGISLIYLCTRKNYKLLFIFFLLFLLFLIGLIGNLVYQVNDISLIHIFISFFLSFKAFFYLFGSYSLFNLLSDIIDKTIIEKMFLTMFGLLLTIIILLFFVYLFSNKKYFSNNFGYFSIGSSFAGTTGMWIFVSNAINCIFKNRYKIVAFIISLIMIYFTKSDLAMLSMVILFFYSFLFENTGIKWYYYIPFIILGFTFAIPTLNNYILDSEAPRSLLFKYSFVTANTFFPIGGGFASYGSVSASDIYSNLYIEYGFIYRYGMGHNGMFLVDSYYPSIIGELGYLGLFIFILINYAFYKGMLSKIEKQDFKNLSLALYLVIIITGLGFNWNGMDICCLMILIGYMTFNSFVLSDN